MIAVFNTNQGQFKVQLFDDKSPLAVNNFVGLAEGTKEFKNPQSGETETRPYYDGLIFHRVIENFMIQGGCPEGSGLGGPGYMFDNENHPELSHSKPGMLAMANRGPNTNGSQFYITTVPCPHLDGGYSIFGEVVEGMDVVHTIEKTEKGDQDRPTQDMIIESIKIER